jgi:hypothetical protein
MMSIVSIDAIKNGGAKAIVMGVASGLRNCWGPINYCNIHLDNNFFFLPSSGPFCFVFFFFKIDFILLHNFLYKKFIKKLFIKA